MTTVYSVREVLTGKEKVRRTLFGPRVFVEFKRTYFDTNTGFIDGPIYGWRKLKNTDIQVSRLGKPDG